ncbi:hypothetical protein C8Q73DRAFT_36536 [Cubamyces lactineus]|nr:hypothetical protein C8Q73DRAFT_36536 [Cubamyces lactineus]
MSSPLADLERATQDVANVATLSGLNGSGIVGLVSRRLPAAAIERGYANLRHVTDKLKEQNLPATLGKKYSKKQKQLYHTGWRLREEHRKMGPWRSLTLYNRAHKFESGTFDLRDDSSSDYYAALAVPQYAPSVHSVDSGWEVMSAPPSPVLSATAASGGLTGVELSELVARTNSILVSSSANTPQVDTCSGSLAAVVEEPALEAENGEVQSPCDIATVSQLTDQDVD